MSNEKGLGVCCLMCDTDMYSNYTHDFKYCPCGHVMVDGGYSYLRYGYTPDVFSERIGNLFFEVIDRKGNPVNATSN